jgi:hypothetical protein
MDTGHIRASRCQPPQATVATVAIACADPDRTAVPRRCRSRVGRRQLVITGQETAAFALRTSPDAPSRSGTRAQVDTGNLLPPNADAYRDATTAEAFMLALLGCMSGGAALPSLVGRGRIRIPRGCCHRPLAGFDQS